jgi:hypothetical protein
MFSDAAFRRMPMMISFRSGQRCGGGAHGATVTIAAPPSEDPEQFAAQQRSYLRAVTRRSARLAVKPRSEPQAVAGLSIEATGQPIRSGDTITRLQAAMPDRGDTNNRLGVPNSDCRRLIPDRGDNSQEAAMPDIADGDTAKSMMLMHVGR